MSASRALCPAHKRLVMFEDADALHDYEIFDFLVEISKTLKLISAKFLCGHFAEIKNHFISA